MDHLYWIIPLTLVLAGLTFFFWRQGRRLDPRVQLENVRVLLERERPRLQEQFFAAASTSGKPRACPATPPQKTHPDESKQSTLGKR